ncbi:hypothetical protein CGLO_15583 [Colletotrichum gloeosporioides Cg-14]|uniref:Uncharacterized protein n=1 Tax=Colletotrichum gloeosporioides (strain Cg-14) TaxID=1237896 RepID=T0JQN7_COLGC|nr:hypothetical protein CGLO_15583 [Colletotrichum gloeosporioides Cg-14]
MDPQRDATYHLISYPDPSRRVSSRNEPGDSGVPREFRRKPLDRSSTVHDSSSDYLLFSIADPPAAYDTSNEAVQKSSGNNKSTASGNVRETTDLPESRHVQDSSLINWNGLPWYRFLGDFLSMLLAICFIALGICVVRLRGEEESGWSRQVVAATELAPSLWPVIFSGVIGNALKAYANWRVEKGTSLLSLEQILGSLTMANTILSVYTLSIFNLWTVSLVLVWAFNPLGSQASFRSLYLQPQSATATATLGYRNYSVETLGVGALMGASGWSWISPASKIAYSSVLASTTSQTQYCNGTCGSNFTDVIARMGGTRAAAEQVAMDPWGNPRIPSLKHAPGYDAARPEEWLTVPWRESVQEYSSLIGNRYHGLRPEFVGNVTFTIEASYMEVYDCAEWLCQDDLHNNTEAMVAWFAANYKSFATRYNASLDEPPYNNASFDFFDSNRREGSYKTSYDYSFSMDYNTTYGASGPDSANSTIFLGTLGGLECGQCMTSCPVRTVYIEAEIACESRGIAGKSQCAATRIRQMPSPPRPPGVTAFTNRLIGTTVPFYAAQKFPKMGKDTDTRFTTFSEEFVENPTRAFNHELSKKYVEWCKLPMAVFADRLGLLFNTFLDATVDPMAVLGAASVVDESVLLNTTAAMTSPLPAVYVIDEAWVAIYFVSTLIMLLAAIGGVVIRYYTIAPQVLGYVGSLVRDSPYFADMAPRWKTTESGEEISRRLGDVKVGVFDVEPDKDVGRIAFAPVEMGHRVRRKRWYE